MKVDRRGFLKGSALVATGLATSSMLAACSLAGADTNTARSTDVAATGAYNSAETAQQKWSFEVVPDAIPDSDIAEEVDADLVVVGAGTAGLITAVSAAEQGLKVIVVSASEKPVSRGGSNNATYCRAMEAVGVDRLTPFQFQKEVFASSHCIDERKWYKHYNNSEEAMNWVIDMMEGAGYKVKVELGTPSEENDLYHETCSIGWDLGDGMQADEGMVVSTGMMQPLLVKELARHLTEDLGGNIYFKNKGERLMRGDDGAGRVNAVICSREDGTYARYNGSKAIVLATGDFSANRDMMYRYAPHYAPYLNDSVYEGETNYDVGFQYGGLFKGDGHKMGLWVGAAWQKAFPNCVMGGFFGPGPRNLYSNHLGLLVNLHGERFMNESVLGPCAGGNNYQQPKKTVLAIWDSAYPDYETLSGSWNNDSMASGNAEEVKKTIIDSWNQAVADGTMVKGDTLEDVADQLGLPVETTMVTVKRYNELAEKGSDDDYHKDASHLHPIAKGPFYGQSNGGFLVFLTVLGGLNTNADMQVCDADDEPIPGLYNVGTMVGDTFAGNYTFMVEGANYGANCITFGYLTGRHIAENE